MVIRRFLPVARAAEFNDRKAQARRLTVELDCFVQANFTGPGFRVLGKVVSNGLEAKKVVERHRQSTEEGTNGQSG